MMCWVPGEKAADVTLNNLEWSCHGPNKRPHIHEVDVLHNYSLGKFFFFLNQKVLIFLLFLHENICCGTLLKAPHF